MKEKKSEIELKTSLTKGVLYLVKLLLQIIVVVGIYQVGVLLNSHVFVYIPSTIYGLILMFCLLYFKVLKLEFFKETAELTLKNLAFFFIPATLGIVDAFQIIEANLIGSIVVIGLSTLATIILSSKLIDLIISKMKSND